MKNYYEVLEVNENASSEVIDKVYKILAKKYHPDMYQGVSKEKAEKRFKEIGEAYEVLSDEERKVEYDRELAAYKEKNEKIKYTSVDFEKDKYQQYKTSNDIYQRAIRNFRVRNVYPISVEDFFIDILTLVLIVLFVMLLYQIPFTREYIRETILNF